MSIVTDLPTTIARAPTARKAIQTRQLRNKPENSTHRLASLTSPKRKRKTCSTKRSRLKTPTELLVIYLAENVVPTLVEMEIDDLAIATSRVRALTGGIANVSETAGTRVTTEGKETLLVAERRGGVGDLVAVGPGDGFESLVLVVDDIDLRQDRKKREELKVYLRRGLDNGLDLDWIGYLFLVFG